MLEALVPAQVTLQGSNEETGRRRVTKACIAHKRQSLNANPSASSSTALSAILRPLGEGKDDHLTGQGRGRHETDHGD